MSSTTSIKLPDQLKARVAAIAALEGKTAHAYMVETLDESTRIKEVRARFLAEATASRAEFEKTGLAYDAKDVFAHFRDKLAGKPTRKPRLKQWLK